MSKETADFIAHAHRREQGGQVQLSDERTDELQLLWAYLETYCTMDVCMSRERKPSE